MLCPFCQDNQSLPEETISEHLIVMQFENGHIHIHGPFDNTSLIKEFIMAIAKEADIEIEDD